MHMEPGRGAHTDSRRPVVKHLRGIDHAEMQAQVLQRLFDQLALWQTKTSASTHYTFGQS
jgi:hypothetical protein